MKTCAVGIERALPSAESGRMAVDPIDIFIDGWVA